MNLERDTGTGVTSIRYPFCMIGDCMEDGYEALECIGMDRIDTLHWI